MNLEFKHLLPSGFSPVSRVWVYQSSRQFSISEALELEESISRFCQEWMSHGDKVKAYGNLFFGRFIILMADESATSVGGCSTDSSVRFIKETSAKYGIDLLNRTDLAFVQKDKIEILPLTQLNYGIEHGFISGDTLFFNNLVLTKKELEENWIVPVKNSWLAKRLPVTAS
jgi:hypothetical protein